MDLILRELCKLVIESEDRIRRTTDVPAVQSLFANEPEIEAIAWEILKSEPNRRAVGRIVYEVVRLAIFDLLVSIDERRCFSQEKALQFALDGRILDGGEMWHDRFVELLAAMTPTERVDAAIGSLPLMGHPGWDRLTPTQQWFVAMEVVEGQVGNGGFHAVYYNDCAEYLPLALTGYEAIGATAQAEIVRSVLQTMREDPWAGPPNTWPDPDAEDSPPGSKDIGDFDEPWWALDASVWDLKAKYVDEQREEFRGRG